MDRYPVYVAFSGGLVSFRLTPHQYAVADSYWIGDICTSHPGSKIGVADGDYVLFPGDQLPPLNAANAFAAARTGDRALGWTPSQDARADEQN